MTDTATFDIAALREEAAKIPVLSDRARFLLKIPRARVQEYAEELLEVFEELVRDSRKRRDQRGEHYALVGVGRCLHLLVRYDEALVVYAGALNFFEGLRDEPTIAELTQASGIIHQVRGEYGKALEFYQRSLDVLRIDNPARIASVHNSIGVVYGMIGDYERGLNAFREALHYYREAKDERGTAYSLVNIGNVYIDVREFKRAEECYEQAREIREKLNDPVSLALVHHALGKLYLNLDRLDEAFEMGMKARDVFRAFGDRLGEVKSLGNLGLICGKRGEYERGLEILSEVRRLAAEIGDIDSLARSYGNRGQILQRMGRGAEAVALLREGLKIVREHGMKELEQIIHSALGLAYDSTGDYRHAYGEMRQALELQQEILGKEKQKALAELQIRFDLENARKEKEIYRLRSEQLEMTNRQQAAELAATAMSLVRKTELIESLKRQVRDALQSSHGNFQETVDRIFAAADDRDTSSDWALFEQRLNETQSGFARAISALYPSLTSTERRICALVRIGLSSREIAGLMNVTERNVESHRHRLRKKLNLDEEIDLETFLRDFDETQTTRTLLTEDPGFSRILIERCPALSDTELKVCTLIRGNLSTKEIAEFLSVSERTAETHRYNIRRKLELPKEMNLGSYLAGL